MCISLIINLFLISTALYIQPMSTIDLILNGNRRKADLHFTIKLYTFEKT